MGFDDLVEVLGPPDHHFTADDRLDSIFGAALAWENPFAGKAQGDDLPPPRIVALELGEDAGTDKHHLVTRSSGFAERTARIDLHDLVRHFAEQGGETGLEPRGDQCLAQGHAWRWRW